MCSMGRHYTMQKYVNGTYSPTCKRVPGANCFFVTGIKVPCYKNLLMFSYFTHHQCESEAANKLQYL